MDLRDNPGQAGALNFLADCGRVADTTLQFVGDRALLPDVAASTGIDRAQDVTDLQVRNVLWTDVGPRDGLQNIKDTVATEVKVRLIRGLLDAGVPRVEATSFVSPKWVPQLADAAEVLSAFDVVDRARLRVLIPNQRGLELAIENGIGRVLFTIAATDSFNQRNVNRPVAESLRQLRELNTHAIAAGVVVDVAVSVAFGCPFDGLVSVETVVDLCRRLADIGVADIGIADTIGVANPAQVTDLCLRLPEVVPSAQISLHVHDTRGLGVANVVAAFQAGVDNFDGSVGGLGGCPFAPRATGNVCSEDALQALLALGAVIDADLASYCEVSTRLAEDLGHDLPGKLYRAGVWPAPTT